LREFVVTGRQWRRWWCFFGAVLAGTCALAASARALEPTPAFRTYGIDQGLPNETVSDLAVDAAGHVWVATYDGLARFDGAGFSVWRHDPADGASIRGNLVQVLLVDRADRLWVGVEDGGLSVLGPERTGFAHFDAGADGAGLRTPHVFALAEAPDGSIWAGNYDGGLHRIDAAGTRLERWPQVGGEEILPDPTVTALRFDSAGWLWVGTRRGLVVLPPERLQGDSSARATRLLPGTLITALSADADGGVHVGTRGGLHRGMPAVGRAAPTLALVPVDADLFPDGATQFRGVVEERGTLWVATTRGLVRRDPDGRWHRHISRPGQAFSAPGNWLWALAKDREGGLWVGHRGAGLSYLGPLWRNFTLFRGGQIQQDEGQGDFAPFPSPCEDGTLWLVRPSGALSRFDPGVPTAAEFADPRGATEVGNRIRAVACDGQGRLLIGYRGGLGAVDRDGRMIRRFDASNPRTPDPIRTGAVHRLAVSPSGEVWLGLLGAGVARFELDTGTLIPFPAAVNGPRSQDIEQIGFDDNGLPWVAGEAGLDRFEPSRNAFVPVDGVPDGRIDAFAFGPDGDIHVHRIGSLLHARIADRQLEPIRLWTAADGLPIATMTGLARDLGGDLWLISPRGLWRHDAGTGSFRAYGVADGLPVRAFASDPPKQHRDGSLFIGSDHGIVAFQPARLEDATVPPRMVVESVRFLREDRRVDWEPEDGPLSLRHDDRELGLVVRTLAFADPGANRYRFRLEGLDLDWVETGARGERSFPTLPSGRYALTAAGANPQGLWSEPLAPIPVIVAEPPWRTWPAFVAYGITALFLLAMAFRMHRQRLQRRHALALSEQRRIEAERQSRAKSEFLADVGHEIRTPMAGLLGMAELLGREPLSASQRQRVDAIHQSGTDLLRLINDLLDLSRIEAGRFELELAPFDIVDLVEEVVALERPVAEARHLSLTLTVEDMLSRRVVGDRFRLKQVLLNLLSNAIKFTERGSVDVRVEARPGGGQRVVVRDTGRGISAAEQANLFRRFEQGGADRRAGSGLGLSIVRGLLERMGAAINLRSQPGHGSEFTVDLELPAVDPDTSGSPVLDMRSPGTTASLAGSRLVVVEDDAVIREVLVAMLADAGATVIGAANGLEGLIALTEDGVAAAVVDLDLPGLDGFGILAWIRDRDVAKARMPVLAVTANSDPAIEARCRAAGFDAFLRKPVAQRELVANLEGLLAEAALAEAKGMVQQAVE
jgi:signal transduction histidine kinase/ligand-binding sensor domain-containing protein/CheY-like chemotaxis protein